MMLGNRLRLTRSLDRLEEDDAEMAEEEEEEEGEENGDDAGADPESEIMDESGGMLTWRGCSSTLLTAHCREGHATHQFVIAPQE